MRDRFNHPAWLLILAPVVWLALWRNLGETSLETSDEAAHTDVARNIIASGQWTRLWYFEEYYFGKPPLKIWLSTLLMKALGQEEWVIRLPDAAMTTLVVLLVWWLSRRYLGGPATLAAPLLFVVAPYPIVEHGWREGVQESALCLLLTLAAAAHLRGLDDAPDARTSARLWLLFGLAIGAASLVKSIVPFMLYGPILAHLLLRGRSRELLRPAFLAAGGLAVVLWLSWHQSFLVAEIKVNILPRIIGADRVQAHTKALPRGGEHPASMYWIWLKEGFTPWGPLLPIGAAATLAAALRRPFDRWLVLWAGGLIVPWLLAHLKHPWYVYPAYPPLALMIARALFPPELEGLRTRWLRVAARILGGSVFAAGMAFSLRQLWIVTGSAEQVPLHQAADWLKPRPEAERALAVLTDPKLTCPDERYYIDLSAARRAYVRTPGEVASMARDEPVLLVMLPEQALEPVLREILPFRQDILYAVFPPRCRRAYGVRVPFRALLALGDAPPHPPFSELPLAYYGEGFGQIEIHPDRFFAWTSDRADIRLVAGCGTLRFKAVSFGRPRRVTLALPGRTLTLTATPEGTPVEETVDVPPGGFVCRLEAEGPCHKPSDVEPGNADQRCLSLCVVDLDFDADPRTFAPR